MRRVFTMKSHHSDFYPESHTLINNTGVTEGILEDAFCCMISSSRVPYWIETTFVIITIYELKMEVETTLETSFGFVISKYMQFQHI